MRVHFHQKRGPAGRRAFGNHTKRGSYQLARSTNE